MTSVVVLGAGLGGLAASALLARAGLDVTVIEKNEWFGGKSRRIEVAGQRIDTGPSLVTFPGVLQRFFDRYDDLAQDFIARDIADLNLERLPEVGRYYYRDDVTDLPVAPNHPWAEAWQAFEKDHAPLGPAITDLLTTDPLHPGVMAAAGKLISQYGRYLSTKAYLDHRDMPEGLRDIIAIHTLNAGVAPDQTLAIFATMAAVMADEGVYVPKAASMKSPGPFTVSPKRPEPPFSRRDRHLSEQGRGHHRQRSLHPSHCGEWSRRRGAGKTHGPPAPRPRQPVVLRSSGVCRA